MATRHTGFSRYSVPHPFALLRRHFLDLCEEFDWDAPDKINGFDSAVLPDTEDVDEFRAQYLHSNILSKFDDGKSSTSKRDAALSKFWDGEFRCLLTDSTDLSFGVNIAPFTSVPAFLFAVRRKIERVLGDFCWEEVLAFCDHGPGASFDLPRRSATVSAKYAGKPSATENMRAIVPLLRRAYPGWVSLSGIDPSFVDGNRITTVPKNHKTDRCIAIEPTLNLWVQKGVGCAIRRRLRKVGVDLNDQSRNRHLAQLGSIDGRIATIDLKSASDTLSLSIVEHLLPPEWLRVIEHTRSPYGVLPDGTSLLYRKVSSMGNAYTFELESLIFWALADTMRDILQDDGPLGVYGDDIIVSSAVAPWLIDALQLVGFDANASKTFYKGRFRESCGGHFYKGSDVTPFYIRTPHRTWFDVTLLHNNVQRFCSRRTPGYRWSGPTGRLPQILTDWRNSAPAWLRNLRIAEGLGDGAFLGSLDEIHPPRWNPFIQRRVLQCKQIVRAVRRVEMEPTGALLNSLWRGSPLEVRGTVDNRYHSFASESMHLRQIGALWWEDLGPWT